MADKDLNDEIRQLRSDFSTLQNDVAELTSLLRDLGAERIDESRTAAAERIQAARDRLRRQADKARSRGQETISDVEQAIGGHPLSSVTMAFGIGFLVAKLMEAGGRR